MKTSNSSGRFLRRSGLLGWLVAACALFIAIGSARSQASKGLEVTLSVFSGRPDPHYRIEDAASLERVRALLKRSSASANVTGDSAIPSILGYRGVIVENAGQVTGVPNRVALFAGVIELGTDKRSFVVDPSRALEKYLVDLALKQGAIDDKLYRKISARW